MHSDGNARTIGPFRPKGKDQLAPLPVIGLAVSIMPLMSHQLTHSRDGMTAISKPAKPTDLPSYAAPPLSEVACGVLFKHLPAYRTAHIGQFWGRVADRYPVTEDAPPFVADSGDAIVTSATGLPLPRAWFVSSDDTRLIQLQSHSLYVNWRARDKAPTYPRYPDIRENFSWVFEKFGEFVRDSSLGDLSLTKYDLTYINHIRIPKDESISPFTKGALRDFSWAESESRFLPAPAELTWKARFPFPDEMGSLNVRLTPAALQDGARVLVLELAARGAPKSNELNPALEWFDFAREWIVRGFTDLTTPEMQKTIWKREV